jgi:hypothetical protein
MQKIDFLDALDESKQATNSEASLETCLVFTKQACY